MDNALEKISAHATLVGEVPAVIKVCIYIVHSDAASSILDINYVQEYVPKLVCKECAQHLTLAHVMLAGKERAVMRV